MDPPATGARGRAAGAREQDGPALDSPIQLCQQLASADENATLRWDWPPLRLARGLARLQELVVAQCLGIVSGACMEDYVTQILLVMQQRRPETLEALSHNLWWFGTNDWIACPAITGATCKRALASILLPGRGCTPRWVVPALLKRSLPACTAAEVDDMLRGVRDVVVLHMFVAAGALADTGAPGDTAAWSVCAGGQTQGATEELEAAMQACCRRYGFATLRLACEFLAPGRTLAPPPARRRDMRKPTVLQTWCV